CVRDLQRVALLSERGLALTQLVELTPHVVVVVRPGLVNLAVVPLARELRARRGQRGSHRQMLEVVEEQKPASRDQHRQEKEDGPDAAAAPGGPSVVVLSCPRRRGLRTLRRRLEL